jgi:hypothetical protein
VMVTVGVMMGNRVDFGKWVALGHQKDSVDHQVEERREGNREDFVYPFVKYYLASEVNQED